MFATAALILAMLTAELVAQAAGQTCSQNYQGDVTFSITGRRNLTGHWIVNVSARQRAAAAAAEGEAEAGPWQLQVHASAPPPCAADGALQLHAQLTVAPAAARPGYEARPALGSRYKLHLAPATWEAARRACAAEAAHLAVIGGDAEAAALRELLARHPRVNGSTWEGAAWVGFDDRHTEGEYLTVLGQQVAESGYNKWVAGQPDNKDYKMPPDVDSDCGGIHRSGLLDDLPCSARYVFICEQELW